MTLLYFIDWLMTLPDELQLQHEAATQLELEERDMPYMNIWERRGMEKGIEKGARDRARHAVARALEARFGAVPEQVHATLVGIEDLDRLDGLLREAVVADSFEAFVGQLTRPV